MKCLSRACIRTQNAVSFCLAVFFFMYRVFKINIANTICNIYVLTVNVPDFDTTAYLQLYIPYYIFPLFVLFEQKFQN